MSTRGPCTLCVGALPEGEWCRACGYGQPEGTERIEPMTGLPFAIRLAKGGCLSTDGPRERAAFAAACRMQRRGA